MLQFFCKPKTVLKNWERKQRAMGCLSCGSQWWIAPSRCPGPGLTCGSVFSPGDLCSEQNPARSTSSPSPSFPTPCSRMDFIFLCFRQHSVAATGKYVAGCFARCCSTHWEKMSLPVGIWVPEQINKKEKWCMSGMMMWRERLGHRDDWEVYPSLLPIDTTPQAARSAPCSLSVRMRGILLTLEWKELLGAPCFPAGGRWCALSSLLCAAFWILFQALVTHVDWNWWCAKSCGDRKGGLVSIWGSIFPNFSILHGV